jgi:hypothetical protein
MSFWSKLFGKKKTEEANVEKEEGCCCESCDKAEACAAAEAPVEEAPAVEEVVAEEVAPAAEDKKAKK